MVSSENPRVAETLSSLRSKPPRSTTLQRAQLTFEGWELCRDAPQPLCLGRILDHVLARIDIPVAGHDLLIGRMPERVPDTAEEIAFQRCLKAMGGALPPGFTDNGHETFDWAALLQDGLPGLRQRISKRLSQARDRCEPHETQTFLHGMVLVVDAFIGYTGRCAAAAEDAGLPRSAAALRGLLTHRPETFHEALQLIWTVGLVYCCFTARNPTLTFGRLDQLLYPFFRADLDAGRLSRAAAAELIEDFYCKNNLILGRGEHQMSGSAGTCTGWERNLAYDAPQYVVLGGKRAPDAPDCSELTDLFLEGIVPRFENPYVVVRHWPGMAPATWALVCEKLRTNASMMVYNDLAVIAAFERLGFARHEAREYTMHGCNWPDLPPSQVLGRCMWHCLPQTLLAALESDPGCRTLDELLSAYQTAYRERLRHDCEQFRDLLRRNRESAPGPLAVDDLFLRGPVARAKGKRHGGVDHITMITTFSSFATLVDSVAAIDDIVFRKRLVTLPGLMNALADNFRDRHSLRQRCVASPKFGDGDQRVDEIARRLMTLMHEEIDHAAVGENTDESLVVLRSLETDTTHIRHGRQTGATPDGRLAGQPLSENSSPSRLRAGDGVTSLLRSLSSLPLDRCHSGALNLRLSPTQLAGTRGARLLGDLLRGYFKQGGLQAQLSVVDTQALHDARKHPERYLDLMVRITGYSAAFVDMSDAAQREIIAREEATL